MPGRRQPARKSARPPDPPPPPEAKGLGRQIQKLRQERNLTQEELAHKAGLDRAYVAGMEVGLRNPALRNIVKIARALGVRLRELFDFD